MAMTSVWNPSD
ncbi:hypothetical protein LINGRAHAP2_LOCUS7622 [Linum grandiflorum]